MLRSSSIRCARYAPNSYHSHQLHRGYATHTNQQHYKAGFTLLEVLVALVIVCTALGASLRAVGSLLQNSSGLRSVMMATWSAENRLTQIRLGQEWPTIGNRSFDCPQGDLLLRCDEHVLDTPNPYFRRVEVSVFDTAHQQSRIVKLSQVVPNAH